MKVWCLVYKEKNMNNENNVLEYDEVCPYSEGRAAVRKGEFWGYVDENGKLVSTDFTRSGNPPGFPYNYAEPFCDGWAVVHNKGAQDEYCHLIDRNCNPMMVDGEYISSGDTMRNGVSIVGFDYFEDYRECFVDKDCHVLSDRFEEISYIGKKGIPYSDFGIYAMVRNGYKY